MLLAGVVMTSSAMADDLDKALDAQKKKPRHRVYSTSAVLDDQNLVVPQEPSAEDQALNEKLRELEKQRPPENMLPSRMVKLRPATMRARLTQNKNWLTPDLMEDSSSEDSPFEQEDPSWLADELERQSLAKEDAFLKEQEKIDAMVQEKIRAASSPQLEQLKAYENPADRILQRNDTSLISAPQTRFSTPVEPPIYSTQQLQSRNSTLFVPVTYLGRKEQSASPPAPRSSVLFPKTTPSQPSSGLPPKWDAPKTEPLKPLERVRKSSPFFQKDPFSDDIIPKGNSSIWD